jgi:E3 ubiquitin-protein ligase DOA10
MEVTSLTDDQGGCRDVCEYTSDETSGFCRLCWGEQEEGVAWELVSPCSCSGSLRHIHRK